MKKKEEIMDEYNNNINSYEQTNTQDGTSYSYTGRQLENLDKTYPEMKKTKIKKPKKAGRGLAILMVVCMVVTPVLAIGGGYLGVTLAGKYNPASAKTTENIINTSVFSQEDGYSLAELSNLVAPTVVEISVEASVGNAFVQQSVQTGAGSGVIISEDGYIVTNNHVIDGAESVNVRLSDGTTYPATYVGSDAQTDLAVIKIEAQGLPIATIGDSDELAVGQDVIAVGNPLGQLGGTVTDGIISALDRDISIDGFTMNLLQTNAAISPGNSGGGLFTADGELVGIVNAKNGGDNVEGLGFAIPSNTVKSVTEDLMTDGYVGGRISVGINIFAIEDEQTARTYGLTPDDYGIYIASVTTGSSAQLSGLQPGDRIKSVNDVQINEVQEVKDVFAEAGVFSTVEVVVVRGGEEIGISLLLTELIPEV